MRCDKNHKTLDADYHNNNDDNVNKTDATNETKHMLNKSERKGKKMPVSGENILISSDKTDKKAEENESRKASSNLYEVTELTPSISQTAKDHNENTQQMGYFYESPRFDESNLTNKFLNILSKYNIMVNDKLPNYALSRRNKGHNRLPTRLMHYPNDLRIPYGYNSLNHLPVDPILAVFLSNYGYYLPGLYGINRNYMNLYGYLASNNIHDNKPFGLYKINSDTDSSH